MWDRRPSRGVMPKKRGLISSAPGDGSAQHSASLGVKVEGPGRSRAYRLSLDVLEDRVTPSTFTVTNTLDPQHGLAPGSLRWAITQANLPGNQGSTVEISPSVASTPTSPATIALHGGELRISSSLTLLNASGVPVTIQQATPFSRVVDIINSPRTVAVTLAGQSSSSPLILTGGNARNANGGGILAQSPQTILTLSYVNVVGNTATQVSNPKSGTQGNGGGIFSNGTLTLDHSSVSSNIASGPNGATGHAGGIYTGQGITLVASHVDGNTALDGAGILNAFGSVEVLNGSTVNNNTSTGSQFNSGELGGGGISEMVGNVLVSQSQVSNNKTIGMYSGGIVLLLGGATVTNNSQVDGNTNRGPGGGIAANFQGAVTVSNGSEVKGNTGAGLGGGIVNFSETFGINVVSGSQVSNNFLSNAEISQATAGLVSVAQSNTTRQAFLSGGRGNPALHAALQMFVNACGQRATLITQAVAALPFGGQNQVGGGIAEVLGGPIVINGNSSINGNQFTTVSNSTQTAQGIGGGVFSNLSPIVITDSAINGNIATGQAGGIWNGLSLVIRDSTVANNTAGGNGGGILNKGTYTATGALVMNNTPNNIYP